MDKQAYTLGREELLASFATSEEIGLSDEEANIRLKSYGANSLEQKHDLFGLAALAKQFINPLVVVLFFAFFATLYLDEHVDSLVIALALLVNVVIGFIQEYRASRAFNALLASQEHSALVLRSGNKQLISTKKIVPGDIIFLESGSIAPADVYLLASGDLAVSEAHLTGESHAQEKYTGVLDVTTPLYERHNMVYMGSSIVSGSGVALVVATGAMAEVGVLAKSLEGYTDSKTPIEVSVEKLARFLAILVSFIVLLLMVIGYIQGIPFGETLLLAIALAVSAVPEGLPAAVTAVLAIGMEALLKKRGLVKNLLAAETLGSTTIILTDKTGTLTEGRMKVVHVVTAHTSDIEVTSISPDQRSVLEYALFATDATVLNSEKKEIHGRPVEKAIASFALDAGFFEQALKRHVSRKDFLKFSSSRRFAAALYEEGEKYTVYASGAPETLLTHAQWYLDNGEKKLLSDEQRALFEHEFKKLASEGKRVIATLMNEYPQKHFDRHAVEGVLIGGVFGGFVVFSDAVRADVPQAIQEVLGAGVRVVMVTGDTPSTARSIAYDAGIAKEDAIVVTGVEIEKMNDEELGRALMEHNIFARVLPQQKKRLVTVLQARGEIVGMTGDGVNDAPALQAATIGIAVGSGTEVAREASDLVLLDNSFSIITSAIREGRRIMDNLKKVVTHLISTSMHEVFLIAFAISAGLQLPILPIQILWVNILEEGFLSFGFAFEPAEPDVMKQNPRSHELQNIMTREVKKLILVAGLITSAFSIGLYIWLLQRDVPIDEIRTIIFVMLSLDSLLFALSLKRLHAPIWTANILNNWYLLFALGLSTLGVFLTLTVEPLRNLLSLTAINGFDFLVLCGVGIFNILTIEFAKKVAFKQSVTPRSELSASR